MANVYERAPAIVNYTVNNLQNETKTHHVIVVLLLIYSQRYEWMTWLTSGGKWIWKWEWEWISVN